MTELEMTIEALKLCVSPDKFEAALNAVKAGPPRKTILLISLSRKICR